VPERPGADGARFIGRHMAVVEPVMHEGERVGTIYLESDLRQLYGHLYRYAGAAALVTLVGLGVSLFASAFLSRLVTRPIHELGRVAANVTSRKDFSLRATKQTHDEIGMLIDAFNDMLARIQERDEALLGVQSDLEVRVRERTAELETINRSLSEEVATRKAIEAQLIDARDHAEAASRAKSTFLANMSHDLRTPLTAVLGYSEMLQEEAQERKDAQSVKDLDCIRNAANHLLSLLSDLLDLSRIEVGRMELQPEFIDLFSFIEEFESTSRPMCEPNHNRLTVWCAPDLREMVTDRTRLRQILYNLVSNATKFTKRGEITLTAERRRRGDAERICFSVRDTGIGMTQEQLSRIFEPFMQGESNTPLMYGGSGLGLAICQRCCELMEGTIDATSTPGKGTTLEVEFPVRIGKTRHTPTKLPDGAA
jgi:signal transduction histidine kinase